MARPRKNIRPEQLREIEVLAGYGLTEAAIANVLGMHPQTFRDRKNETRVFRALQRGRADAEKQVGEALFNKAVAGDIGAIRWWEMTRAGRFTSNHVMSIERVNEFTRQLAEWAFECIPEESMRRKFHEGIRRLQRDQNPLA